MQGSGARELVSSAVLIGKCEVRGFPSFVNNVSRRISSGFVHGPGLRSSCREVKCDFLCSGGLAFRLEVL